MADLQQLIKNIEQWAEDRNLIEGSTPQKQFIKLMEEFGELCSGVSKNKIDVVKDSIGDADQYSYFKADIEDHLIEAVFGLYRLSNELSRQADISALFVFCFIRLLDIAYYFDLNIHACVQAAWNEIKDRKGRMIDGVFVKEGDL